jgi:hypothetical protein
MRRRSAFAACASVSALMIVVAACGAHGAGVTAADPAANDDEDGAAPGDDTTGGYSGSGRTVVALDGASDAGANDAGSDADGDAADKDICVPSAPPTSFTFRPPVAAHQGACTRAQISQYVSGCGETGNASGCSVFRTGNKDCTACIETPVDAPSWGAVVIARNFEFFNVPGCIMLVDAADMTCAAALENQVLCAAGACPSCGSPESFSACASNAGALSCGAYTRSANECTPLLADAGKGACSGFDNDDAELLALTTLFCGD